MLGGDNSFGPVDVNLLVIANQNGVEFVIIDNALFVCARVVQAIVVLVNNLGVVRF